MKKIGIWKVHTAEMQTEFVFNHFTVLIHLAECYSSLSARKEHNTLCKHINNRGKLHFIVFVVPLSQTNFPYRLQQK